MANELIPMGDRPSYIPVPAEPVKGSSYSAGISSDGMSLPMVSIRGGKFRLRQGEEEVTLGDKLQMLFVASRPAVSKRYYDKAFTPGERTPPRCWAADGENPQAADGEEPIASKCSVCPMNQWGSAVRNGVPTRGKACGDYKRLIVYPLVGSGDTALVQAAVLDVPSTSLKAKKGEPPGLREWTRALEQNNAFVEAGGHMVSTYACEASFMDTEGQRLVFEGARWATKEELDNAIEMATSDDVAEALGDSAVETKGPIFEAKPEAVKQVEAQQKEEPKAEPKEDPKPEPEPEVKAAQEAKAEPKAEPEVPNNDLLAQLQALLKEQKK